MNRTGDRSSRLEWRTRALLGDETRRSRSYSALLHFALGRRPKVCHTGFAFTVSYARYELPTPNPHQRIRRLVATLLVLCAAPVLALLFPLNVYYMPLLWATSALPLGVIMTLSFWVGLGNRPPLARLLWGMLGAIYVAAWSVAPNLIGYALSSDPNTLGSPQDYALGIAPYFALVAVFGGMFMLIGRYWSLTQATGEDSKSPSKSQFSVLNLLLLTTIVAVLMTLIRESRNSATSDNILAMLVTAILAFSIFFCNTACAAFAALMPTPIKRNCVLVLCISVLFGIAISLAAGHDRIGWWFVASGPLVSVMPTAVVLVSLLVVRSAGYRLVRKPAGGAEA